MRGPAMYLESVLRRLWQRSRRSVSLLMAIVCVAFFAATGLLTAVLVAHQANHVTCPYCSRQTDNIFVECRIGILVDGGSRIGVRSNDSSSVPAKPLIGPRHEDLMGFWAFLSRIPFTHTIRKKIYDARVGRVRTIPGIFVQEVVFWHGTS